MIRTIGAVVVLLGAVLFLPLWVQGVLFVVALIVVKHKSALVIPAIVADVLYRPGGWSIGHSMTTLVVLGAIFLYWFLVTRTRIESVVYGVAKK